LLRRNKKPVEGWALDMDDTGEPGLRERLASSNKLWLACLVLLVAATFYYAVTLGRGYSKTPLATVVPGGKARGTYDDDAHKALADRLVKIAHKRAIPMTARFLSVSHFEMVVPSDTSSDDISSLSRFAAEAIYRKFGNVPIVYVYARNSWASKDRPVLVAITRWSERERNFLAKFLRATEAGRRGR